MSAAILYLDVDDEITSAAARIRAATSSPIVIVLPGGSRLATSRINFRLLAREAAAAGRALEIVAADPPARALAAAAGLAVHASVAAFEAALLAPPAPAAPAAAYAAAAPAPPPVPPSVDPDAPTIALPRAADRAADSAALGSPAVRRPGSPSADIPSVGRRRSAVPARGVAIGLAVVLVLLVGGAYGALTYLPTATITLTPRTDSLGPLELTISAEPGVTEPDPAALVVPASRFPIDVEVDDTFAATGLRVDEAAAAGEVTFQNCDTGRRARIDAGSVVSTGAGIEFATTADITVDRASVFPFACKTASVGVVAVLLGVQGNVPAGAIDVIPEGFDPIVLSVTNLAASSGGKHDEFPRIEQADLDAALAALEVALAEEFDRRVADTSGLPDGTTLFPETARLGEPRPDVDPATLVGLEQAEFALGLSASGSVIGVDPEPVGVLADARIRSEVPAGSRLDESSIDPTIGRPIVAGETVTFPVTVTAVAVRVVDRAAILAAIKGLPLHEARVILEREGAVTIEVWPDWVTSIPTLDERITFTLAVTGVGSGLPVSPTP